MGALPYPDVKRIALDIDSTLHHYWDLLERVVLDRHGVDAALRRAARLGHHGAPARGPAGTRSMETHSEENIAAAEPYPDAVETVRAWHEPGHWIHVTSHRAEHTCEATARWLERIGLPYDDLHCSWDKITRCVELDIDILVDDSPINIGAPWRWASCPATILHPWNEEVAAEGGVITGRDWPELRGAARAGAISPRSRSAPAAGSRGSGAAGGGPSRIPVGAR